VVLDYTYDAVDNLTQVNDSIDGVAKGVESFTYDQLDRVTKITQSFDGVSDKRVDMSYDAASQMTGMSRYSDLTGNNLIAESNYTFDTAGRLTNLIHGQDGNVLSAYEWAYDAANRITQTTNPDGVADYNYDKTDQLTQADHDDQADENYSYDQNGNRTNAGYVTGANNQLLSDGTFTYEYDAEGNRLKRIEIANGEITEYSWDYRNRLVGVVTKNSSGNVVKDAEYTYDVFDRRITKSVDADGDGVGEAVVERFVYDGDHIALTFDAEGNQTERFLHGTQIDQVLAQENANGEVFWALADHQGSVKVVLDNDGNIVNQISYDAFGRITDESNPSVDFRFTYTGRELDPETGLYNYRTRFDDPNTGQFINEDTIGFAGGDTNLYRYISNNPVNGIDPFGYRTLVAPSPIPTPTPTPKGGTSRLGLLPALVLLILGGPLAKPVADGTLDGKDLGDLDPLKINPEQDNNDFFNPDKPDSWFDKNKERVEDINRENDRKEKDHQSDSCPAPWASSENPSPNNSQNGNLDNNDGQDGGADESQDSNDSIEGITSQSVLDGMSNNNLKHSKKHLEEFQALDPNITENSLRELGASIVKPENLIGNPNSSQKLFEKTVDIDGTPTKIRVALNERNKLHSVHIRRK
jgi:RHS repeat-associated protein